MAETQDQRKQYLPQVTAFVQKRLGNLPVEIIPGGINLNYAIGNPPRYFLKVGIWTSVSREMKGLEILCKNGVPAPEVILYDPKAEGLDKEVLVLRYTPHDRDVGHDVKEIGRVLSQIHHIKGEGYGHIDPDSGKGTSATWQEFLRYKAGIRKGLIDAKLSDKFEELMPPVDDLTSGNSFLHLDYTADNILSKDGKVAAVIDPHVAWGHPLLDIAFTSVMTTDPQWMREFMQGYAPKGLTQDDLSQLRKYRIIAALNKYWIVVERSLSKKELNPWWQTRKARLQAILGAHIQGKDDEEFVKSFL